MMQAFQKQLHEARQRPVVALHDFRLSARRKDPSYHVFYDQKDMDTHVLERAESNPKGYDVQFYCINGKGAASFVLKRLKNDLPPRSRALLFSQDYEGRSYPAPNILCAGSDRFVETVLSLPESFHNEKSREEEKTSKSFENKNSRRLGLIDKKYGSGLTQEEEYELKVLQEEVGAYIDKQFPLPFAVLEQMEEMLTQKG